jgi:hypothetical protein
MLGQKADYIVGEFARVRRTHGISNIFIRSRVC